MWGTDDRQPLNWVLLDEVRKNTLYRLGQNVQEAHSFRPGHSGQKNLGKNNCIMHNHLESSISR